MKLTIYYDGQFYVGLIEIVSNNTLKAYRHIFGNEPKDQEVLDFVNRDLLLLIQKHKQAGVSIDKNFKKKINPKRLQRSVSKELKQPFFSSKAQEAIKKEYEQRKKVQSTKIKQLREEQKQHKREIKLQKAKRKHRSK
ncbi:YjdF family protein [Cytobacillus sp.]|uniref:YjdF family protein n=1 Tax=Cytobacillus sp. TaxID=2675269 RepID=UPI0028BE952E|nr:YjdF family protein [Cytobacillus sp.]